MALDSGGLFAALNLEGKPVDVLLIDQKNFHTFTPLLYQVATCALDPSEIAYPVRGIFRNNKNIEFMMGKVVDINKKQKEVIVEIDGERRVESYDYLIIAAGSAPNYFGNESFKQCTFGLRSLNDAITMRNHILKLFESAAWEADNQQLQAMTTLVVVGGGPTGLEIAGALYELYNHVLGREFSSEKSMSARVILIERMPHLLSSYPEKLRQSALKQLRSLGVEVILGKAVTEISKKHIRLEDGSEISTNTVIWSAGVQSSSLSDKLGIKLTRGNRIPIKDTLEIENHQEIYAIGDIAYLENTEGEAYQMLIPVAKQQGILAAKNILRHIKGENRKQFKFHDRGIMTTIGRSRAVAWIFNSIQISGYLAWVAWLFLHLLTLMGFRNQLSVLVNWIWNYFTFDRSVRIILR